MPHVQVPVNALKTVFVGYVGGLPLSTPPSEVPQMENARLAFVCVGTEANQRSDTAKFSANPYSTGNCGWSYAPITSPLVV